MGKQIIDNLPYNISKQSVEDRQIVCDMTKVTQGQNTRDTLVGRLSRLSLKSLTGDSAAIQTFFFERNSFETCARRERNTSPGATSDATGICVGHFYTVGTTSPTHNV